MDDITDELKLARKQLIAFARRMATDRLIRCEPMPAPPLSFYANFLSILELC
jgi:hypothetical protein